MARTKCNLLQLNESKSLFENINGMDSIEDDLLNFTQNTECFFEFVFQLLLNDTPLNYSTEQLFDISMAAIEPLNQLFDRTMASMKDGEFSNRGILK
jgi:hypothetical protein